MNATVPFHLYEELRQRVDFLEGAYLDLAQACEALRQERDKARRERDKAILRQLTMAEMVRRLRAGEKV